MYKTEAVSRPYNPFSWVMLMICLTMLTHMGYLWVRYPHEPPRVWEHEVIAQNFLKGKGFVAEYLGTEYRALLHPFYPLFCVGIYRFFRESPFAVSLFQVLVFVGVAFMTYWIGKEIFCEETGALAAFFVCLHPGLFIFTTHTLHPLIVDCFWFTLFFLSVLRLQKAPTLKKVIASGIILGCTFLSRSTIFLFAAAACLWLYPQWDFHARRKFFFLAVLIFIPFLVLIPWTVRNFIVFRHFIPITSTFGLQIWSGNNPHATGTLLTPSGEMVLGQDKAFLDRLYQTDELGQAKLFREEAVRYIREHPFRTFKLFLKKIYYFWWFAPQSGLWYPPAWRLLYRIWYGSFAFLAVAGLGLGWRNTHGERRKRLVLLLLFLLSISLFQSLFFVEGRHRLAVESFLLVLSAEGARRLLRRARALEGVS